MKCIKHVDFINLLLLALGQRYIHCSAQQALFPLHCYSSALSGSKMNVSKSGMCGETADPRSRTVDLLQLLSHNITEGGGDVKVCSRNIEVGLETWRCKMAPVSDGWGASPQC